MLKSSEYGDANSDKVMNDRRKHVGLQNPDTLTEICYHEINRNHSDNKELFLCFFPIVIFLSKRLQQARQMCHFAPKRSLSKS